MKFDLFLELASPPGSSHSIPVIFEETVRLVKAAEACGFDAVWLVEHHFLAPYSSASCPDMILAALARETRWIKLGFGIVPLPLHDPVRVAERLATLDMIAPGRVLWGVGRGIAPIEMAGFGITPEETRPLFRTRFEQLETLLREGAFTRDGRNFEIHPQPSPSLGSGWLAAVSPESFDLAAELGLNAMTGPFKPWPLVKSDLARYRALSPGGGTSFTMAVYCETDHRRARKRAEPGLVWAYRKIFELARPLLERQIEGYEHYRRLGWVMPVFDKILNLSVLETMGLAVVGSPDHVASRLRSLRESGLDRVGLVLGGGDLSEAEVKGSIELLARDVFPAIEDQPVAAKAVAPT